MSTLILDNEAVSALRDPHHPKHRRVVAHLQAAVTRRRRGDLVQVVVPTSVRVEAGWDRTAPTAAVINRFPVVDRALDTGASDLAAAIRARTSVSVADAHIGAVARAAPVGPVAILTSDPGDIARVCDPVTPTVIVL